MILPDANLLLYAVNTGEPRHAQARAWWEAVLSGTEPVGLAWPVVLAFLRLSTHPKVFPRPLTAGAAAARVDEWFAQPNVVPAEATTGHWILLKELLSELGTAGNLTSDAHLAALAIEHGAVLCSADNDFARFPKLRWVNPLSKGAP